MDLNQIKFCRSGGGVKLSEFSFWTVKPTLGLSWGKNSFNLIYQSLSMTTLKIIQVTRVSLTRKLVQTQRLTSYSDHELHISLICTRKPRDVTRDINALLPSSFIYTLIYRFRHWWKKIWILLRHGELFRSGSKWPMGGRRWLRQLC